MSPTATDTTATPMPTHQPYTTAFLARLAAFVLHTPRPKLKRIFDITSPCAIASLDLDPDSPRPNTLTTATCQRLVRMLNVPRADASHSTVPLALCLLLRFRMVPASHLEDTVRDFGDGVWIASCVLLAFKLLTDHRLPVTMQGWADDLKMPPKTLANRETQLMRTLEHKLCVRSEEFDLVKKRPEELWRDLYSTTR